jgi:hypothetical protein
MKINFLTLILILIGSYAFAQNATLSPYSFYGLGQPVSTRTAENSAMGGVTSYADSTQFSLDNPATLGKLRYVQYRIGANYKSTIQQSPQASASAGTASLNYLALSVPTKHFAFSFGLKPKSAVGYRVSSTNELNDLEYRNSFDGSGGINSTFLAFAANPFDGLSLGVSAFYNFGFTERTAIQSVTGVQNSTQVFTRSELSGIHYTFGMHYNSDIFSNYTLQLSATYTPNASLESTNSRLISTVTTTGSIGTLEEIDLGNLATTSNKLAAETSFGLGFGKPQHWFAGITYVTTSTGTTIPLESNSEANFVPTSRFSVGGYYIPKHDSFTNYLSRVVYRVGARLEHTGLEVKNQAVEDFGITFGIGLPMNVLSKINIGVEIGQLGTTDAGLIKENYTNIMLSFSLSDIWFIKRKYD